MFFSAGFLGGVLLLILMALLRGGPSEGDLPVGFVITTLPTLLIPNRLDVLGRATSTILSIASQATTSRSAGLSPKCQGTGYCYVCRGQGVHLGGDCFECMTLGQCVECSGTGGRSVL